MNNEYPYDPEDDNEAVHQEWVPLGYRVWLILYTWPDGSAEATWAIQKPDGPGFEVHLGGSTGKPERGNGPAQLLSPGTRDLIELGQECARMAGGR